MDYKKTVVVMFVTHTISIGLRLAQIVMLLKIVLSLLLLMMLK